MPKIITLSNGKRVANFSSPHPFEYEDGTILPAVAPNIAEKYKVTFHENIDTNGDVLLSFTLSSDVHTRMAYFQDLYDKRKVDVVVCPLPMITAMRAINMNVKNTPFRTIRVADRINKVISINYQCI